jgi:hypothetical protein
MSYLVKTILKIATNEDVARKKRLDHPHQPAPRGPLKAQPRVEHLQTQPLAYIGGGNMLVLGLRSRAIPCCFAVLHLGENAWNELFRLFAKAAAL